MKTTTATNKKRPIAAPTMTTTSPELPLSPVDVGSPNKIDCVVRETALVGRCCVTPPRPVGSSVFILSGEFEAAVFPSAVTVVGAADGSTWPRCTNIVSGTPPAPSYDARTK
eukprot:TRINITY_DN4901_c0_g1_i1.p3 TRINITY_DN4901_c0_g1~~TRINITY_DN4901_c0_g1_i1.p3  ORF type:complete len:112 (-),score=4.91 TRINITY_DN4901_c0_g1_i1:833-1168(-)